MWEEKEITVGDVDNLIKQGYEVEVTSPDGWVPISEFVNKGEWEEYKIKTESGLEILCNENHLFETPSGWMFAKDMDNNLEKVVTINGIEKCNVIRTGNIIPIVDIVIDHPNHRYYSNGISSHNTNVGKSLFLCHLAASYIKQGHNVLYITAEMAEERIAERIDCNLLDMQIDEVEKMSKGSFTSKITSIQNKTHGKLIIKEYPTSSAHAGHFKALLDELEIKKAFKPKVIIIDYLNICAPQRQNRNANSYTIIKNIAEELRALAVEYDVPVWTATQTNRGGFDNSDVSLTDTSESFGLPMTVDFMFAMVRTEELDELGQILCIQLKSRYNNVSFYRKFVVGVDITMFKLFDVDQVAQNDVMDDKPVFDKSKFGQGMGAEKYDFNFE